MRKKYDHIDWTRLKQLRDVTNSADTGEPLQQKDIAVKTGMTQAYYSRIERGEIRSPDEKFVRELAATFGMKVSDFLQGLAKLTDDAGPEAKQPKINIGWLDSPKLIKKYSDTYNARGFPYDDGVMMANEEYVSAPPFLNDVPDAYAIVMPADTMEPRYRAGDTLYVNPEILPYYGDDVVIHIQFKNRACAIIREVIKLEGVFTGEHDEPIPAFAVLSLSEKEELRRKYIKKEGRDPIDDPLVFAEVAEWFVINAEEGLHEFIEGEGIEVEPKKAIIDAHVVVGSQRKRFMEERRHVHMEIKDSISVTANIDAVTVKTSTETAE